MGLTTWKNSPDGRILKSDVTIAKNYLDEKQIRQLERAVTGAVLPCFNRSSSRAKPFIMYSFNTFVAHIRKPVALLELTREKIDIVKLNAEIKEIVTREEQLRAEIDKIIAEIEESVMYSFNTFVAHIRKPVALLELTR